MKFAGHNHPPSTIHYLRGGVVTLLCIGLIAATNGCTIRKAMYDQPKYITYGECDFFGDGASARPLVEGTIARGQLHDDTLLYEGKVDGKPAEMFPFPVTKEVIQRGQNRFNIYCTPCHDALGTGHGMVVQRGFKQPPSYHIDRLRQAPPGYFFDVITHGFGQMNSYVAQVKAEDRWAIVAYIRTLQYSENATLADVPESERAKLEAEK